MGKRERKTGNGKEEMRKGEKPEGGGRSLRKYLDCIYSPPGYVRSTLHAPAAGHSQYSLVPTKYVTLQILAANWVLTTNLPVR